VRGLSCHGYESAVTWALKQIERVGDVIASHAANLTFANNVMSARLDARYAVACEG
jgi:hypothetical protein